MTWNDVINGNFIGGDVETHEDGDIYRGPISNIETSNGSIVISSKWIAKSGDNGENWENWQINSMSVSMENITPNDIGNGRVQFNMPALGMGILFPKGGSKLDPSKVKGLDL